MGGDVLGRLNHCIVELPVEELVPYLVLVPNLELGFDTEAADIPVVNRSVVLCPVLIYPCLFSSVLFSPVHVLVVPVEIHR